VRGASNSRRRTSRNRPPPLTQGERSGEDGTASGLRESVVREIGPLVIPAKAGIQGIATCPGPWVPAFAGTTTRRRFIPFTARFGDTSRR